MCVPACACDFPVDKFCYESYVFRLYIACIVESKIKVKFCKIEKPNENLNIQFRIETGGFPIQRSGKILDTKINFVLVRCKE